MRTPSYAETVTKAVSLVINAIVKGKSKREISRELRGQNLSQDDVKEALAILGEFSNEKNGIAVA